MNVVAGRAWGKGMEIAHAAGSARLLVRGTHAVAASALDAEIADADGAGAEVKPDAKICSKSRPARFARARFDAGGSSECGEHRARQRASVGFIRLS
jgi:hypothetical protein